MLSVIVTAYNEESCLKETIATVKTAHLGLETILPIQIVIANDGSRDRTQEVAESIAREDREIKVIRLMKNQGAGAAFLAGVEHCIYSRITVLPGDNSLKSDYIRSIFLNAPTCQNLFTYIENKAHRGPFRAFLSKLHHNIYAMTFGIPIAYIHGTPVYQKTLVQGLNIKARRYSFFSELAVKVLRSETTYAEVPGQISSDPGARKSSAIKLKVINEVVRTYVRLILEIYIFEQVRFKHKALRTLAKPILDPSLTNSQTPLSPLRHVESAEKFLSLK